MNRPLRKLNRALIGEVDGVWLGRLLLAASQWLTANKETLNRINVFPVVDGDTGTNMSQTLRAVSTAIRAHRSPRVDEVAAAVAEASLMGARGNSGMILSHFFTGVSDLVAGKSTVGVRDLAHVFRQVSQRIYDSLDQPVEGTILTVLKESSATPGLENIGDLEIFLDVLCDAARASLARTPEKLAVLRRSKVVDAGAQGYVYILEGMLREVQGLPLPEVEEELPAGPRTDVHEGEDLEFRYCTEVVIEVTSKVTAADLRRVLSPLGNSLIPLISGKLGKVHIHTNEPERVFADAGTLGKVIKRKVEDMRTQSEGMTAHHHVLAPEAVRTRIVADSTCDLPAELVAQRGIGLVPLRVNFGDECLKDKFEILPDEFYHRLTRDPNHPTTSQPAPEDFSQVFRRMKDDEKDVVCVVISSKLSGTINSAGLASKRVGPGISVFDSMLASTPVGLMVLKAADLAAEGKTGPEIVAALEKARAHTNALFMVDTLEYLRRGGRISGVKAFFGNLLDLKPILELRDGRVEPLAKARGRENAQEKMFQLLEDRLPKDRPISFAIGHTGRPDLLGPVEDRLRATFQVKHLHVAPIGSVVGVHVGPGAWGIAYMVDEA